MTQFIVYFTPYNSVEVWNERDFGTVKRNWKAPTDTPQRTFIHEDSIPVSTLPDTFHADTPWKENIRDTTMQGLAYSVPMYPIHPDSVPDFQWNDTVQ